MYLLCWVKTKEWAGSGEDGRRWGQRVDKGQIALGLFGPGKTAFTLREVGVIGSVLKWRSDMIWLEL